MSYTIYSQSIFNPLSNLLLSALFLVAGYKLFGVAAAYIISSVITALLSYHFLRKVVPGLGEGQHVYEDREIFRFSLPFLFITLLMFLMLWTDVLVLGRLRSPYEVGIYSAAAKTALFINALLLSFSHIFSPIISELYGGGEIEKLHRLFKTVTRWSYSVSLPVFLLIAVLSREIMSVFGPDFTEGRMPLVILSFAQIVNAGTGPLTHILMMSGRQNMMLANAALVCTINIALNIILVSSYGMTGAAAASGLSVILFNMIMMVQVRISLNIHPYDKKFLRPTLYGTIAYCIVYILQNLIPGIDPLQKLLLSGVMLLLIYAGLLYFSGFDDEDQIIADAIKKKLALFRSP